MLKRICHNILFLLFISLPNAFAYGGHETDIIIPVTNFGIKNDGSIIGTELNELVRSTYGKTLYFPAGTYNLSESIILPYDYSKNVNIILDKNALIKTDVRLESLLKIGFSEMSTPDKSHRRFSYIEGGMFDCSNVENGIIVNGLKQLVSLKSISLFKGRNTHIRIEISEDFIGTGSADTKIDNITIQGLSSNEEVYGIFIDEGCADIKISNSFIYGTKYGITTKSGGHIFNNIHILSQVTTGGLDMGVKNFLETEGICLQNNGFFILHEIYFDTIDKSIVVSPDYTPTLVIDKNIFYSYLPHFGTSFIYRDHSSIRSFQAKISNSVFHIKKHGYTIFDINPLLVGYDINENYTFINCHLINSHLLNTFDSSLLQKVRKKTNDALFSADTDNLITDWHVIGTLISSPFRSLLRIDLSETHSIELDITFNKNKTTLISSHHMDTNLNKHYQLGYIIKDNYCVLVLRSDFIETLFPVITDLRGNGSYMRTPSTDRLYKPIDYGITSDPTLLINSDIIINN